MLLTDAIPMMTKAFQNNMPVLLVGPPGIGKTDAIHEATSIVGMDMMVMHPAVSDPTDFKGLPFSDSGEVARFLPFEDLSRMIHAQAPLVVLVDDIGQAPLSVQAALMQLFLARRVGEMKISDKVVFVGATNRRMDKGGVVGLTEPIKSRFAAIINIDVDPKAWVQWALKNNMPSDLIAFIRFRPHLLHDFKPSNDLVNSPCPRTVANVGKWINLGVDDYEVLAGAAGEGFAAEYLAYRKLIQHMPHPDRVLADPDGTEVPADPAVLYALCGALAHMVNIAQVDNLFRYNERVPKEFQSLLVTDTIVKNPAICTTRPYMQWATANHDLNFGRV